MENMGEEIQIPKMDASILMSLLEESHCEEYYNEEEVNSLMESLEAEIRMANPAPCTTIEGDTESFEWAEMETAPSSPSDDMNWYLEEMPMDELVRFGNDFAENCYGIHLESSLWQETYDTAM
ncbi:hypothetical protein GQ457_01G013560 [Hibiscus cannabinus]